MKLKVFGSVRKILVWIRSKDPKKKKVEKKKK